MAGHKFWTGRFSRSDRDDVLFYYPGDQNWWRGSYDSVAAALTWQQVSTTPDLGDVRAALTGNFARTDRTEILVQDPDTRRWRLGTIDDGSGGFWWRFAANTDRPHVATASAALRSRLQGIYGRAVPGCVFYVTRNGRPFADGSFGRARLAGAPDGELAMSAYSLVHTGSVGKFICAVAILRLIEEWNRGFALPATPGEPPLYATARAFGKTINLAEPMFPLVEPFLDKPLIASYTRSFPGLNVDTITIEQLLNHTSDVSTVSQETVLQAVYWEDAAGALQSAADFRPVIRRDETIEGQTAQRTDLLGGTFVGGTFVANTLPGGRGIGEAGMVELRGFLRVAAGGVYRFRLSSDDGSLLWLDDALVVDNNGNHPLRSRESGTIQLEPGQHPLRVEWYNAAAGGAGLLLEWWTPSGTGYEAIPEADLTP